MDNSAAAEAAHTGMGTEMAHKAFGRHSVQALRAVENEAQRLERLLSRFRPESDISRINRSAGVKREKISSETYKILSCATECSVISQGLFDITVGPLADLWDYKHALEPPANNKIELVLPLVNYNDLELDAVHQEAGLKTSGQAVDLGGIGKGFTGDRFMEIFQEYGVRSAFSNIGGNVSTLGNKPDGSPWRVGIRHPRLNGLLGAVAVTGKAVVTSGDYERYFLDKEGRRFHHILNPITGYPAESGLVSVTVVADSAMTADALSTAVFVAGLERGLALIEKYTHTDAVLVNAELQVYVTRGLRKCFQAAAGINVNYV
ncbi:FAD:protein FMN transferase [Gelria sp. Kuro-4]|uniref:FAD:protein FMN transferase n=1 Tax=Gelria sp. Kuro-4 TaxID=2796927 RepID=UPI001BF03693|nr:FAD:protein FMN transferase [Gelria sp. Kuro-4]BCV23384.1 thiamine biosynthesis lipoprotein ApbE [Gelria sp. Kuro-4]